MRRSHVAMALVASATPLFAQQRESRADRFLRNCDGWGGRNRERFCEVRDIPMKVGSRIHVDGRDNGGVHFSGWDKNEILVRALIQAGADTRAEAEALARDIKIETALDASGLRGRQVVATPTGP